MKGAGVLSFARYALPLSRPLTSGPIASEVREGALLRSDDGRLADLCPLPGLSAESLDGCLSALHAPAAEAPPALGWALHVVDHGLVRGLTPDRPAVPSALLVSDATPTDALVEVVAPSGTVKLKVAGFALDEDRRRVRLLAGRGLRLRLDGNRRLSVDAALALADAAGDQLDFLEEPVAADQLATLAEQAPVGLDKILTEVSHPTDLPAAAAWVLKPTLLGANRTLNLVEHASAQRIPVIISSCYESAVGRQALAAAARAWAPQQVHGLGTDRWFAADLDDEQAMAALTFAPVRPEATDV